MTDTKDALYPKQWNTLGTDFNPKDVMIKLERFDKKTNKKIESDYLGVPGRLMWFITDQRCMIVNGIANTSYEIRTEMVVCDVVAGYAQFKTYIRDVLGNEATMYGSETKLDFGDYSEKASTKSVGRALLMLGYGTNAANELDEGERIVDAPVVSHKAKTTNDTTQNNKAVSTSNNTVANTNKGDTSTQKAETTAAESFADSRVEDAQLAGKITMLAGQFGYTLMDLKMYVTAKQILWQRPTIINLINALEDHEQVFKLIAHFTKIPFETFQEYAQKTGKTWDTMYLNASNPRRQEFYNAVYPQNTTQQPLSQSNIPAGSI